MRDTRIVLDATSFLKALGILAGMVLAWVIRDIIGLCAAAPHSRDASQGPVVAMARRRIPKGVTIVVAYVLLIGLTVAAATLLWPVFLHQASNSSTASRRPCGLRIPLWWRGPVALPLRPHGEHGAVPRFSAAAGQTSRARFRHPGRRLRRRRPVIVLAMGRITCWCRRRRRRGRSISFCRDERPSFRHRAQGSRAGGQVVPRAAHYLRLRRRRHTPLAKPDRS